jgi:tetratricopeptide (TPR) repeat protein
MSEDKNRLLALQIEYNLGVAYYQKAQYWAYDQAEKSFNEVVDILGEHPQSQPERELLALSHSGLVNIAAQRSTKSDANVEELWITGQHHLNKVTELASENSEIQNQALYSHALLLHLNRRNFQAAREKLHQLLQHDPYHWRAYTTLGQMALAEGEADEAITYLKSSANLAPHFEFAYYQLGHAYSLKGQRDQAVAAYSMAPTIARAHLHLGRELAQKKNFLAAVDQFEEALTLNSQDADAYADLAWYLAEGELLKDDENRNRAVNAAETAVKITDSKDWRKLGVLGRIYYECGQVESAKDTLAKALLIEPDSPHAHYYQARIFFDAGNYKQAERELITIFQLGSNAEMERWRKKTELLMGEVKRALSE